MSKISIVVAADIDGGIGIDGQLPWRIKEDMAHFRRQTVGRTVIMGRKTFESIGSPLPHRRNIVLTHNRAWRHEGVEVVHSLVHAIELAGRTDTVIIGGGEIYKEALPIVDRIVLTEVMDRFHCDTFFPAIDRNCWEIEEAIEGDYQPGETQYRFVTMARKK